MGKLKGIAKKEEKEGLDRKGLLAVLDRVKAAVDKSGGTGIDQAQHFIIQGGRLLAYNDRISISAPLTEPVDLELSINANDLHKVVSGIGEERVNLEINEDGNLCVFSDTTEAVLSALPLEGDFLELVESLNVLEIGDWVDLFPDFTKALRLCGFSASRQEANVAWSSLKITGDAVYSTDNWRISRFKFPKDSQGLIEEFLLPNKSAKELCKHAITQIYQGEGTWVHFQDDDGLVFSARTVVAEFDDPSKFFKVKGDEIEMPVGVGEALKQVLVFAPGAKDEHKEAEVVIGKGKITVRAENERGWIEHDIVVPGLKPIVDVPMLKVNPIYFAEILERCRKVVLSDGAALFKDAKFSHVMRLSIVEK